MAGPTIPERFARQYACQTRTTGVAVLATVTGYAASKPALLSAVDTLAGYGDGTTLEMGGFVLEMLITDFSARPPKGTAATCNGSATGISLRVLDVKTINSATYLISVGDINA